MQMLRNGTKGDSKCRLYRPPKKREYYLHEGGDLSCDYEQLN